MSKELIKRQIILNTPAGINITISDKELNILYHLSMEYQNNRLTKDQLVTEIINLRGGDFNLRSLIEQYFDLVEKYTEPTVKALLLATVII